MLPNKVVSIADSVIWKMPYILDEVKRTDISVEALYEIVCSKFDDISEFILCLDTLYLLNKINFDKKYEVLQYVD